MLNHCTRLVYTLGMCVFSCMCNCDENNRTYHRVHVHTENGITHKNRQLEIFIKEVAGGTCPNALYLHWILLFYCGLQTNENKTKTIVIVNLNVCNYCALFSRNILFEMTSKAICFHSSEDQSRMNASHTSRIIEETNEYEWSWRCMGFVCFET